MRYRANGLCRVCGQSGLEDLLFLGDQPLANSLKAAPEQPEDCYPLTLAFCSHCSLVQICETVDKELLFSHYVWVSGTSSTTREFAQQFYNNTQSLLPLTKEDLVVEVASNDGTFLRPYVDAGIRAVGVDPASNIAAIANERGIETRNAFWNLETAEEIVEDCGQAQLVFARNVIPHVSELHDVMAGICACLDEKGIGAVEFHYAGNILKQLQYDSIYHEHLCYFGIKPFEYLLKKFNLYPFHIDLSPISGGAYVVYFSKNKREKTDDFLRLESAEKQEGVDALDAWKTFGEKCITHRKMSQDLLAGFEGKTIVGFGASARSSTYLNFCQFTGEQIDAIIDNNALKHGQFSAGSSIPIVSFEDGLALKPDLIFILAWNFRDEIIRSCRAQGYSGAFVVSFPDAPQLIEA